MFDFIRSITNILQMALGFDSMTCIIQPAVQMFRKLHSNLISLIFGKFFGGPFFLGTKFPGDQISRGPNFLGTKFPGDQISWGPNFLGTKFLGDQISWGPKRCGAQISGDQISRGPNFLGTKKVRGPNETFDHFCYSPPHLLHKKVWILFESRCKKGQVW